MKKLKEAVLRIRAFDYEAKAITALIKRFAISNAKILDVGCGYGRYLRPFLNKDYKITGIELNRNIINQNKKDGLFCLTPEEFDKNNVEQFDMLIISHLIEHFPPDKLVDFMEKYLGVLKSNGILILATPIHTSYFYKDFDHIRPYYPKSISQIFGHTEEQIFYISKNKLDLVELKFLKGPFQLLFFRGKYIRSWSYFFILAIETIFSLAYIFSYGKVGTLDRWIGVYKKQERTF